jgi:ribosomal protein S5
LFSLACLLTPPLVCLIEFCRGWIVALAARHHSNDVKMDLTPLPSGRGIVASDLLTELCNLVGIKDIRIKARVQLLWLRYASPHAW